MSVPLTPELAFELQAIRDAAYTTTGWKEGYLTLWEGVGAFIEKHSAPSEPREDMTREEEMTEIRQMVGAVNLGANIGGPLVEKLLFEIIGRRSIEEMSAAAVLSAVPSAAICLAPNNALQEAIDNAAQAISNTRSAGWLNTAPVESVDLRRAADRLVVETVKATRIAGQDERAVPSEHPETIQHDDSTLRNVGQWGEKMVRKGDIVWFAPNRWRESQGDWVNLSDREKGWLQCAAYADARLYRRDDPPSLPSVPDPIDVLRRLYDNQNDCPLPKYQEDWDAAMKDAEAVFAAYDPQPAPPQSKETPVSLSPLKEGEALFQSSGSKGETAVGSEEER